MVTLEKIQALINEAQADAAKANDGNKAAKTRVRVKLMDIVKECKAQRIKAGEL